MTQLNRIFGALSDETRFAIVERLMRDGELPAGALVNEAEVSAPAISRHLKVLVASGLLQRRVKAQQRLYSVRPEAIEAVSAWTMSHRDFWEASLNRLEAALKKEMKKK